MKWIVPAWVQGRWKAAVHAGGKRRHFRMVLGRRYQFVDGTALVAGKSVQVQEGRLRGRSLTFRLPWSGPQTPALVVEAEVGDDALRGHWRAEADDRERGLFYALRERA
jgi:ribosomal protein L39E